MPNFFLSYKRVKVAGCMARPPRRHGRPRRPGFEANAPRSGPRTAGFSDEVGRRDEGRKRSGPGRCRSDEAMKLFTGWVLSAGLVLTAAAANAQVLAPYEIGRSPYAVVSDIDGPYAAMPRDTSV